MNNLGKNLALWVIIGLLLLALFNLFQQPSGRTGQVGIPFSDFVAEVANGQVREVTIKGNQISGFYTDGRGFSSYAPNDPNLVERLTKRGVVIKAVPRDDGSPSLLQILISWFPMLLLIGVWIFFMRQMQSGGGKAMGFGKSKARLLTENAGRVTFDDVAGIDEAKTELEEVVEFLRDPQKFQRLGGKIPKGVLLVGP
ncbi:MAG: cell division protease FtsH, partial [Alphaproteobacteria bacterium]